MRRVRQLALSTATAALLATSLAAPADARRYRHWDRNDGIDAGDLIVGAIIIGGIAVLASEIGKARDKEGGVFGDRDRKGGDSERAAINACSDAAEGRARQSGREARVTDVTDVEQDGEGFRVRGTLEYRSSRGWDDWDRNRNRDWQGTARFVCNYSYGRVDEIWLDDGYAWR